MVKITKTSDTKYQYANILIFGESGSGKTHFLGTAPKGEMVILNITSESGMLTLRNKDIDIIDINSVSDFEEALRWLATEGVKKYKYVGIDSFSQFQKSLEKQSRTTGWEMWAEIKQITKSMVDRIKEMPINLIALCEVGLKDDDGMVKYIPSLVGKSKDEVAYWFDEVYFFEKTGKSGDMPTYRALTNSGSKYPCKSRIGTLPVVIENPTINFVIEGLKPLMEAESIMAEEKETDNLQIIKKLLVEKKVLLGNVLQAYKVNKLSDLSSIDQIDCRKKLQAK